ncbi:DNA polymerase III subunit delta' [Bacillus sp. M6-12]|uniref:GlcG/HbpS family heme-binding protein n=1 Tax=Bacillus sp. M6-12 TaxID=2054166 RepID=UPI000C769692|nr:heme-binding protein [Bacillus sp. M6-12]PLS17249.1 DNA polymerase III subunit delta' [Bacillus sp. M6-12]
MGFITLAVAKKLLHEAEQRAKRIGVSAVIAVVDEGGHLAACHRMDDSPIASIEHAQDKAWTAVAMKRPTSELASLAAPNGELFGINKTNNGRVVILGGGIPILMNGKIVGAVGSCCGDTDHDIEISQAAVEALKIEEQAESSDAQPTAARQHQNYLQEFYEQHLGLVNDARSN